MVSRVENARRDVQVMFGTTGIRAMERLYTMVMWSGKMLLLAAGFTLSFNSSRSGKMLC